MENKRIENFMDLNAWKEGHKEELFGLTSQMRRCAVSITSNIAEGFSRQFPKEKTQFYSISLGSITELQNQLLIARDTDYIPVAMFSETADQLTLIQKITNGLIKSVKRIHNT